MGRYTRLRTEKANNGAVLTRHLVQGVPFSSHLFTVTPFGSYNEVYDSPALVTRLADNVKDREAILAADGASRCTLSLH